MFKFAILNAFRRKSTLLIAIIGTGLGVGLMTTLLSLSEGMDKELTETTNRVAGDITVAATDAPLGGIASSFIGGGTPLPLSYQERIRSIDHVINTAPRVSSTIPKQVFDTRSPVGSPLTGVNFEADRNMDGPVVNITEGKTLENEGEIIMGTQLKRRAEWADTKIELGMQIVVPLQPLNGNLTGALPSTAKKKTEETLTLTLVGIFRTDNPIYDSAFYTDLSTARKLARLEDDKVSSFRVRVEDSKFVEEVAQKIEDTFSSEEVTVATSIAKDILGDLNETLDIFDIFLFSIGLVSAIAGGLSIFIIMLMNVMERMREFGIFKASGWSNLNLITTVILESVVVSLLGSLFGLLMGFTATKVIDQYLGQEIAIITRQLVAIVISFGIIMGITGGLYPALRAAKVSPIKTIKGD